MLRARPGEMMCRVPARSKDAAVSDSSESVPLGDSEGELASRPEGRHVARQLNLDQLVREALRKERRPGSAASSPAEAGLRSPRRRKGGVAHLCARARCPGSPGKDGAGAGDQHGDGLGILLDGRGNCSSVLGGECCGRGTGAAEKCWEREGSASV